MAEFLTTKKLEFQPPVGILISGRISNHQLKFFPLAFVRPDVAVIPHDAIFGHLRLPPSLSRGHKIHYFPLTNYKAELEIGWGGGVQVTSIYFVIFLLFQFHPRLPQNALNIANAGCGGRQYFCLLISSFHPCASTTQVL